MYSKQALSYLHCGVVVQFHDIHDHSPSQHCSSCLCLTQRHEEPKITSFNFQFSGITALSPGGSIFLSGTRISRLIEHKVLGTGIKKLSSALLTRSNSQCCHFCFRPVTPGPANSCYGRSSAVCWTLDLKHIYYMQSPGEICPSIATS